MRRIGVLLSSLAILTLFFPTAGFAAVQWPADFQADLVDSSTVQLKWQNVESYSHQILTKTGPLDKKGVLDDRDNPATGQKTFPDTNQQEGPFQSGIRYSYQLQTTKGEETQTTSASVLFVDSEIFVFTMPAAPTEKYTLSCRGSTASTITLGWSGNVSGAHTLTLYHRDNIPSSGFKQIAPPPTLAIGTGTYTDDNKGSGLTKGTYLYRLAWEVTKPDNTKETKTVDQPCSTQSEGSDAPSLLNAWALSPNSLYVNWKDNSVRPHTFELQRIKLTPKPGNFDPLRGSVKTLGASAIKLFWKNDTNTTAGQCAGGTGLCKGPFYHAFERVFLRGDAVDPKAGDPTANPFVDRNGDKMFNASDDSTFTVVKKAFTEDINPAGTSKAAYEADDAGLAEGMEYYYRAKACSFIKADLTKDKVDNPTEVCSKPGEIPAFVATTTLPAAPTLTFTGASENSLTFEYRDRSVREDGFEIAISPCPNGANPCVDDRYVYLDNFIGAGVAGFNAVGVKSNVTVGNLNSGTPYTITVRAFRDSRLGTGRVFSQPAPDSRITYPYLVTSAPQGSITPVCPAPPSSQACYYSYNIPNNSGFQTETVTAGDPDDSDYFEFSHLSGCDAGNVYNNSCTVTMNGNRDVTAVYNRIAWPYTVKVDDTCVSPAIHTSDTTPCAVGAVGGKCPTTNSTLTCTETVTGCTPPGADVICNSAVTITTTRKPPAGGYLPLQDGVLALLRPLVAQLSEGAVQQFAFQGIGERYEALFASHRSVPAGAGTWWPRIMAAVQEVGRSITALFGGAKSASAALQTETVDGINPLAVIDAYFNQFVKTSATIASLNQSVFLDAGLEVNTAYLYRVKAVYTDGKAPPAPSETAWSSEAAGKTLPTGATDTGAKVGICTRNSLCEQMARYNISNPKFGEIPATENQCSVNGECRDVGTSRQFFEETR